MLRATLLSIWVLVGISGPVSAEGELAEAQRLTDQGQYARALKVLDAYLGAHAGDAQARFLKGLALARQDRDPESAIEVFKDLTRDFPELPEPYNNLAVLYAAEGRYEEARDALQLAIKTHPSYATAQENLGDVYARMAARAYNRALALDQANRAAEDKLRLVGDLFSAEPTPGAPGDQAHRGRSAEVEVLVTALGWAAAWAEQDVPAYLGYYAPEFRPPGDLVRPVWEAQRRARLSVPRFIAVQIAEPRFDPGPAGGVRLSFIQTYRSDAYADRVRKTLVLGRVGGAWKILEERTQP